MRFLLDSHTLIWYVSGDTRLSDSAIARIDDTPTECCVSIASLWEIAIKQSIGKLDIGMPLPDFIQQGVLDNDFGVLQISPQHIQQTAQLPLHHRDPFDRMLVAQAVCESLQIVSADTILDAYGITRIW